MHECGGSRQQVYSHPGKQLACALGTDSERTVTYVVATTSTAAKCSSTSESEALLLALPNVAASVQQRKVDHCLLCSLVIVHECNITRPFIIHDGSSSRIIQRGALRPSPT